MAVPCNPESSSFYLNLRRNFHEGVSCQGYLAEAATREQRIAELTSKSELSAILPTHEEYKENYIRKKLVEVAMLKTLRGLRPVSEEFSLKLPKIFETLFLSEREPQLELNLSAITRFSELQIRGTDDSTKRDPKMIGFPAFLKQFYITTLVVHAQALVRLPLLFPHLIKLEIADNAFPIRIPKEVEGLALLSEFSMIGTIINGFLPPELFTLLNLKTLRINSSGITKLPGKVNGDIYLKKLHLDENNLEILPKYIFQSVKYLYVSDNKLTSLPSLPCFSPITHLDVSFNPNLRSLPSTIHQLRYLQSLSCQWCGLENFSGNFGELCNLAFLDLLGNPIKKYPDMSKMEKLITITGSVLEDQDRGDIDACKEFFTKRPISPNILPPKLEKNEKAFFDHLNRNSTRIDRQIGKSGGPPSCNTDPKEPPRKKPRVNG